MPEKEKPRTHIKEIILENFMSYEYARIPFEKGLNLICGPNGAGKSSVLLGLSVALGQTYTERSRKLSDLIRRGEDIGRVSVVFDNSPNDGKKPIPDVDSDSLVISRYLKRDGTYWHEANYETVTKNEITRTLSQLSINPDNMLIVMHQGMIDVFGAIDAQERLELVEEAVGIREYRDRILKAREKLSHTLSEEESVNAMLEEAQETLDHWEEEYQRYKQKQELLDEKDDLERRYAWSKWWRQKEKVEKHENKLSDT
ncbi:MAG: AAA family ATPase, partial [Hadesarchaea archaeon]|nr:AAA family ATPase [Hadesarchaea archaeon]